ncbi:deoxyribonuclease IV [Candidatus Dependentiae bacterium]|nr:deoxyribonuclease IV [Candidatus Dependentiae bacterium]
MKNISLHIRAEKTLDIAFDKAKLLDLNFFQCFLLDAKTKKYFDLNNLTVNHILKTYRKSFKDLIFHGSYFINMTQEKYDELFNLKKELLMAQKLEFTHGIFHPGSKFNLSVEQARNRLVKNLNIISKNFPQLTIIIENSAHGGNAFGSDLSDFEGLFKNIDFPEKIKFCIDTAHAYSFGYDISNEEGQKEFFELLNQIFLKDQIGLIHLNDTDVILGQKIDRHVIPGHGNIGSENLKKIIKNELFQNVPIILELPDIEIENEKMLLNEIRNWF